MAYININTYDILELPEKDDLDDYFECDEFIAPIISLLNKKGYKTKFCCEGHLFDVASTAEVTPRDESEEPSEDTILGYVSHEAIDNGDFKYLVHMKRSELHGYITFEAYVNFGKYLDTFPETNVFAYYDNQSIRWDYIDDEDKSLSAERQAELKFQADPYKHFEDQIRFLKDMYEWAKSLPNYDSIISDEDRLKRELMVNDLQNIKEAMYSDARPSDVIDTFFDIYFMNYQIMQNGKEEFTKMLTQNFKEKADFFKRKFDEIIVFNNDSYSVRFKHI